MQNLDLWMLLSIVGLILIVIEIMTPTTFFINLALASFVTAGISVYTQSVAVLTISWVVLALLFMYLLKPLQRRGESKLATGMEKYVGKTATVLEDISATQGVIRIFDERWDARSENGEQIFAGEKVIIVKNEDLTMYVKKEN